MKDFNSKDGRKPSASFVVGAVALLFLIIGYQVALFVHKASVARVIANHDEPDTVFILQSSGPSDASASIGSVTEPAETIWTMTATSKRNVTSKNSAAGKGSAETKASGKAEGQMVYRKRSDHSPAAGELRRNHTARKYESFCFDPNTVSIDDLMRLGFSLKQAQSIDNYRQKGGRFRRRSDFAKSYVVDDSVYRRLERYIDIPKIDLNSADSAAFMSLPGIGKFFAGKMVSYREELGGYSYPEQLMEIWHFDKEKFDSLKDLIKVDTSATPAYSLWTLPEEELARHPYIGKRAARSIVIFRDNSPKSDWTVANLQKAGILEPEKASRLVRCRIATP